MNAKYLLLASMATLLLGACTPPATETPVEEPAAVGSTEEAVPEDAMMEKEDGDAMGKDGEAMEEDEAMEKDGDAMMEKDGDAMEN